MRLFTLSLLVIGIAASASAQTNYLPYAATLATTNESVRKMSLMDCIQGALEKNIELQIARYSVPIADFNLRAAYAGWDPTFFIRGQHNFDLSGGGFNTVIGTNTQATIEDQNAFNTALSGLTPWGLDYTLQGNIRESYGRQDEPFDSSSGSASIEMTQPLLKNFWIDSTRLNIRLGKIGSKQTDLTLMGTIMNTVGAVEAAYYDLIAAQASVEVQKKALELANQLVAENRKRVEVGALAPLDEKQAEAQAATSEADLIRARFTVSTMQERLKRLISDDFVSWVQTDIIPVETMATNKPVLDLQESWRKAMTQNPGILASRLNIEAQGVRVKYDFNQLFPQVDLVGSYGHGASGAREFTDAFGQIRDGSQPNYYYGAQLTVPLGSIGSRNIYKASKVTLETTLLQVKADEQNLLVLVHNDIETVLASYDSLTANRKAREYAEAALDAEQKKLESGKSTTYTVLQMQRDLTSASAAEIAALVTYSRSLSKLSLDEGSILERLHVNVETAEPVR